MRIVSYARVSTLGQESTGESLPNQERTFSRAIDKNGWTRLRAYREAASAGTVAGRFEFRRMIDELAALQPDAIVVDTLDRFTRNLREGLELLEQLRGHGVGLLPLDWRRERPIDVDDDRDWGDVVEEFTAAERERRRIRRRIVRAYEGRRERGATTVNLAPFGLKKLGDNLVADVATAWIVREAEDRLLAGHVLTDVLRWLGATHAKAWRTSSGLRDAMVNRSYVQAGVRTEDRQADLDAYCAGRRERYGFRTLHEHEFTGVFLCGVCDRLLVGHRSGAKRFSIVCARKYGDHTFAVSHRRIGTAWRDLLAGMATDAALVDRWAASGPRERPRRSFLSALAKIDQRAAALKLRRDAAFDLLAAGDPALVEQAKQLLRDVNADESELQLQRSVLVTSDSVPIAAVRDAGELRATLAQIRETYDLASERRRNEISRAFCRYVQSHPRLVREGRSIKSLRIEWPELGIVVPLPCVPQGGWTQRKLNSTLVAR